LSYMFDCRFAEISVCKTCDQIYANTTDQIYAILLLIDECDFLLTLRMRVLASSQGPALSRIPCYYGHVHDRARRSIKKKLTMVLE
jgi:hypothetical protein